MLTQRKRTLCTLALGSLLTIHPPLFATTTDEIVEIKRDQYGVPHIYADTTYALFYGYGYAVAEDRLFQTDMARRAFTGRTAEVLGRGEEDRFVAYDRQVRMNYLPISIEAQLNALTQEERAIFQGYADGFNAYLDEIEADPELLPNEYLEYDFSPEPISDFDVVMIWVGSMANRFSDVNLEIANYTLLQDLIAAHGETRGIALFDELRWIIDESSPTTAPTSSAPNPLPNNGSVVTNLLQQLKRHSSSIAQAEGERQLAQWGGIGPDFAPKASNIWITSPNRVVGGETILINGPQFGWYNPSYVYGVGLYGAGFHLTGNTPFAYPVILFGTNGTIAWGATAGPQDVVDIYQEQLNPDNPYEYRFQGSYQPMELRESQINIRGEAAEVHTFYSTVHGPIIHWDHEQQIAYSKKRSWSGYEVQSLLAWVESMRANNWEEYQQAAQDVAISINWYYSDREGNIGYLSPGYLPHRPETQDTRLPAIGDGTMEWLGILDFQYTPKSFNPDQGYLTNWNNRPAPDKKNTDAYYWTYGDRVNELNRQYEEKAQFTPEELWAFNRIASYRDVNFHYFKPYLEALKEEISEPELSAALTHLLSWDGNHFNDPYYRTHHHSGRTLFRAWLEALYDEVLIPWLPEHYHQEYRATGFSRADGVNPGSINLSMGSKILLRQLAMDKSDPERLNLFGQRSHLEVMSDAFATAYQLLKGEFDTPIEQWRDPSSTTTFSTNNFTGIPQALSDAEIVIPDYHNRGTENNQIRFTEDGVLFCDVVAPGQSGFISPRGIKSPHYEDQLALFFNFDCKSQALHLIEEPIRQYQIKVKRSRSE